ncbi:MAG: hypothetical protein JNL75_06715 [Chitinophagales bacterium]|nr:hypothetical protein [Chitinophagales bacterium]
MNSIKNKLLVFLIIITSLLGYLEWGGGNKAFLFEMEMEVISRLFSNPGSIIHPLTILPMIGQLMLIFSLWREPFYKKMAFWGLGLIAILLVFILVVGVISLNWKIVVSVIPFLILSGMFYFLNRK